MGLVFGGRKEKKKRKCRPEMTRQREDFGPHEGRRQTRVGGYTEEDDRGGPRLWGVL